MATLTLDHKFHIRDLPSRVWRALGHAMTLLIRANRLSKETQFVLRMSDEDLARHGLKREDLPCYLTRDLRYL